MEAVDPRTPIESYTLVLAIATIGLWYFTYRAASAARATVNAFIDVERANIVMTLGNFGEKQIGEKNESGGIRVTETWLKFDVVANNIGRSAALITHVAHAWQKCRDLEQGSIMVGPPKSYIVKAGDSTLVTLDSLKTVQDLRETPFLWLLVSYKAPLCEDEQVLRVCFEVFGAHSNIPYKEVKSEYWKWAALQATGAPKPWWRRLVRKR
jgi:hypothetical protein